MIQEEKQNLEQEHVEEKDSQEEEKQETVLPKAEDLIKENEELKKELEEKEKKIKELTSSVDTWTNKYYKVYADIANTRKEIEKEQKEFKKYATQSVIQELIPTLDSFDMALKNEPDDEKLKSYLSGFIMIHSKILNALKSLGVEVINPNKGDEYDPHKMEAFSSVEGEEDNKVADTFLKGYKLHEHLLRPAGVIVTKKKVEDKKEDK